MRKRPPDGTLGTIHNAKVMFELMSQGSSHQLTDLATHSGLSMPTVHRLLRSLVAAGFVEQDPESARYSLGPQLLRLGEYYASSLAFLKAATPFLVELRNQTRGTVLAAVLVDADAVYVDHIDGDDVGGVYRDARQVHQALSCAAGRVLAANAPDDVWKVTVAEADDPPGTREREAWRTGEYLVVENVGPRSQTEIAAPVRDGDGTVRGAVTVTGDPVVYTVEHLEIEVAPYLLRAVKAASMGLARG